MAECPRSYFPNCGRRDFGRFRDIRELRASETTATPRQTLQDSEHHRLCLRRFYHADGLASTQRILAHPDQCTFHNE